MFLKRLFLCILSANASAGVSRVDSVKQQLFDVASLKKKAQVSLKTDLKKYHFFLNQAPLQRSLLESADLVKSKKMALKSFLLSKIRLQKRNLLQIQQLERQLSSDLKILNQFKQNSPVNLKNSFKNCSHFPTNMTDEYAVKIKHKFNETRLSLSGVSLKSNGWWFDWSEGAPVKACQKGVVADLIIEKDSAVVMMNHGQFTTLYIGLEKSSVSGLKKNQLLKAGMMLGLARSEFYFEVQKNQKSIDPRQLFSKKQLNKIAHHL